MSKSKQKRILNNKMYLPYATSKLYDQIKDLLLTEPLAETFEITTQTFKENKQSINQSNNQTNSFVITLMLSRSEQVEHGQAHHVRHALRTALASR
jgi:hypothetical protein